MKLLGRTLLTLAMAACGSINEPDRDTGAPVQTDRLSYSFSNDGQGLFSTPPIRLEITNKWNNPAYLLTRNERPQFMELEGLEDGEWVHRWSKAGPDQFGPPVLLQPGESTTLSATIEGFLPGTCECGPIINFGDGTYRLVVQMVDSFNFDDGLAGDDLPLEFRISNEFALDAP